MRRITGNIGLLLLGLALTPACSGYRSEPIFPKAARRVAVPIFENETFFRQIELDLTQSVCDELRGRPGIHVVDPLVADIILEGTITDVDQRVLSITNRRRSTESSATTKVSCTVLDAHTKEKLKSFSTSERVDFAIQTGEGLQTAQRQAFYELARKIVYELEADW